MRITTSLLSLTLAVVSFAAEAVLDLNPDNFESTLARKEPKLVEFYADWCGHCKNLAPIYEELAQSFQHAKNQVVIAKLNADVHRDIGGKYDIQGFPTLKWFDGDKVEDYKGGRDLDSLSAFITEKTGLKAKSSKPPSKIQMLTDRTFNETVQGSKNVLVAFTAPWCGHCKTLAPIWESVANNFANEPSIVIAKVDATSPDSTKIAEEQGISGYPTIKWFGSGKKEAVLYSGHRGEEDFVEYINKEAGTFRTVGGGLTALAGTIPSVDTVLEKLAGTGNDLVAQLKDSIDAATGDKYSIYYRKVAEKLQKNANYVEKEWTRLSKIISKGNLAPEKLDDLTSRFNILEKFKAVLTAEKKDTKKEEL